MAYTLTYDYGHEGSSVHQHKEYTLADGFELHGFLTGAQFTVAEISELCRTGRVTVREPGFALELWHLIEVPNRLDDGPSQD